MKKQILLLVLISGMFIGCSDDSEGPGIEPPVTVEDLGGAYRGEVTYVVYDDLGTTVETLTEELTYTIQNSREGVIQGEAKYYAQMYEGFGENKRAITLHIKPNIAIRTNYKGSHGRTDDNYPGEFTSMEYDNVIDYINGAWQLKVDEEIDFFEWRDDVKYLVGTLTTKGVLNKQ